MHKSYCFALFIVFSVTVFAQKKKEDTPTVKKDTLVQNVPAEYALNEKVYKLALKYSDLSVARNAIYTMLAINPANKSLRDSLALLYFNSGSYAQCILLSREILADNPNYPEMLEVRAVSEQNIGLLKEALEDYEKLYAQTKNVYYQYQVAVIQFQMKRYGECELSIQNLIKEEKSLTEKVNIGISNNQQQAVPLKAAALNIRGVMMMEGKREEIAKTSFQEALKIMPDFELAKNNLAVLQKTNKPQSNTTPKPKK